MNYIFVVGLSAAVLTTAAFMPQVIKAHNSKHTKDLSFAMYVMLSIGIALWIIYGFFLGAVPVILANGISLLLCLYLLFLKVRYG